jgi:hypothetical protein
VKVSGDKAREKMVHLPVSSTFENINGFSVVGPLLTPSLKAIPFPNKKRPGTRKPSSPM